MKNACKLFILLLFNPIKSKENGLEKINTFKGIMFENRQIFEFVESPKLQKISIIPRQETNTNLC